MMPYSPMARIDKNLMLVVLAVFCVYPDNVLSKLDLQSNVTVAINRMKAVNLTEHIQNETHRFLIVEQLVFCPMIDPCSIRNSLVGTANCCSSCSCDDNCMDSVSCCLDKVLADDAMEVPATNGHNCTSPQLIPNTETLINTTQSFAMITKCSQGFSDRGVVYKCNVGQQTPREPEMTLYLPVTSLRTNESYRNKFCAVCNLEDDEDLIYWKTNVICVADNLIFSNNARELMVSIINGNQCNVFFQPIFPELAKSCIQTLYNSCNVTGLWRDYDSRIEWACQNYENPYNPDEEYYKNIFCYICNSQTPYPAQCFSSRRPPLDLTGRAYDYGLESFAALFDFVGDAIRHPATEAPHLCPPDFRYDTNKDVCREITCMSPFVYKDGVCKNVFEKMGPHSYEIFLKFNKTSKYYDQCHICSALSRRIIQEYVKMQLMHLELLHATCSITVLYGNDSCLGEATPELDYLIAHVQFYFTTYHDPMHVAEILLKPASFHINTTEAMLCIDLRANVFEGIFDDNQSQRTHSNLFDVQTLHIDKDSELSSCNHKSWVTRLTRLFICPHVNISLTEFNFTTNKGVVCLDELDICVAPAEYIYSDNGTRILICMFSYFQTHTASNVSNRQTDLGKTLVSFVCSCLSILSLIFTLVTYSIFPVLRTLPGLYTMTLCATLIIAHALFTFGAGAVNTGFGCAINGLIIHLTMLASVLLMNVCSINMFRVFRHLDRQHILTEEDKRKQFVIGLVYSYVVSGLLVAGHVTYSYVIKGEWGYGNHVCFINNQNALLFTFTMPVILIVLVNVVLFCIVIWNVSRLPDISASSSCQNNRKRFLIYVKLSSLTGIAWLVGFIGEISKLELIVYIFIILLSGQGIFIMFSFMFNKRVYSLYRSLVKHSNGATGQNTHKSEMSLEETNINSPEVRSRQRHVETRYTQCVDGVNNMSANEIKTNSSDEAKRNDIHHKQGNDVKNETGTGYVTKL